MNHTLQDRLLRRELGNHSKYSGIKGIYGDKTWVHDLDIVNELGGHHGCVNALSWSKSGTLLASGSDDQHLNIHSYQPDSKTAPFAFTTTIATGHRANIFSVKFMPHSNDRTLVTCAGDAEVRIFDIEYSGQTSVPSNAANLASTRRGGAHDSRQFNSLYNGIRYLSDGNTNARVYRSHGDRVKRIVTESSPHFFLTCSEDGEVRQWDLRLPSSAYPSPRTGRGSMTYADANIPPPLISYKRYHLDLNTISCSASQPHYIALGGAHLHAFLHDRRMLGRDVLSERGQPDVSPLLNSSSEQDDEQMGQATRCVRRFAPQGQRKMGRRDNGHITACKISDANPNEMVVSWSGDHIYSFDLVHTPDAREGSRKAGRGFTRGDGKGKAKESGERKRKRKKGGSDLSAENVRRRSSQARRSQEATNEDGEIALRFRYENGQSEDISIDSPTSMELSNAFGPPRESLEEGARKRALQIARSFKRIRKMILSLDPPARTSQLADIKPLFISVIEHTVRVLPEIDNAIRTWRYPVNPLQEDVIHQRNLRRIRDSTRRVIQATGTLCKLLGRGSDLELQEPILSLHDFQYIQSPYSEGPQPDKGEIFCIDFLKAIILWLEGGRENLLKGFKKSFQAGGVLSRFPIPEEADLSGLDEYLIPYLLRLAQERQIPNVDANRFEVDSSRRVFETETAAVVAFSHTITIPFEELSRAVAPATSTSECSSTPGTPSQLSVQNLGTALRFWGFKVGRGLLEIACEGLRSDPIVAAFGGSTAAEDEGSSPDIVASSQGHFAGTITQYQNGTLVATPAAADTLPEGQAMPFAISRPPSVSTREGTTSIVNSDDEVIRIDDLHDEIADHLREHHCLHEDYSDGEGEEDEDADADADADSGDDDDGDINSEDRAFVWQSASDRGRLRERVEAHVPVAAGTRKYVGHCNVKTVKDVNFYGLNDEFVVSGSDDGNLFIWDKKTSQLLNILEGDGEVVNVIQGHPYEPLLAVSGIDHTIKILSSDARAQGDARKGINLGIKNPEPARYTRLSSTRRRRNAEVEASPEEQEATTTGARAADEDDESQDRRVGAANTENARVNGGLASRKRMHNSYQICSRNDTDRQMGIRDAYITRGMIARLATQMRGRQAGEGGAGGMTALNLGEGGMVILDDNCMVM